MKVKRLAVGSLDTNCYIASSGKKCVIVDPGADAPSVLAEVARAGLEVQAILLTHGHFDHFLGAGEVQEATGAPVYINLEDMAWLNEPGWMKQFLPEDSAPLKDIRSLDEGQEVAVGDEALRAIHTPGHSPGSSCFYAPGVLFAGDLVFKRGVGRTDLPGGDPDALRASLKRAIELPGETLIYPGHGPVTTVADEKARNPFLA